jgi:hypothetical protein
MGPRQRQTEGRPSIALVALAAAWATAVGCSKDIFDLSLDLQKEVYTIDLGPARGDVPAVPCSQDATDPCSNAPLVSLDAAALGVPAAVDLTAGCDDTTRLCYAQATVRVSYTVSVLEDPGFAESVARRATSFVRVADLGYTVPASTTNFALPSLELYVGPAGSARETDPDVVPVGSTTPLGPDETVMGERHLTVADGSAARDRLEADIQARRPFTFVFVLAPRLDSGQPIPAGALEIDVTPHLLIGFPR